jgi:hypothetical protein
MVFYSFHPRTCNATRYTISTPTSLLWVRVHEQRPHNSETDPTSLSLFARALLRLLLIDPIMILQEKELDVGNRCK